MKHLFHHHDSREEYRHEHMQNIMEAGHRSYCKIGNTTPPGCLSVAEMAAWLNGNNKAKAHMAAAVFKK